MKSAEFFDILVIAVCCCGLFTCTSQLPNNDKSEKPNIIFVLADDLGYGDLGCYGQKVLRTPNIDRMADEGMRFTQAYAGNTVCCPSRSSLMTGLHPGHARHRGNYGPFKGKNARIPFEKGTKTMATYLKTAGYTTGHIGKWHLGGTTADSTSALGMGFDYSYSRFPNYLWTTEIKRKLRGIRAPYYPDTMWRNEEMVIVTENLNQGRKIYIEELYTDEALSFIKRNVGNPFFLYLAYTIPHAPQVPYSEEPFADRDWPEVERKFAAEVFYLDQNMGKIFDLLQSLGIDDHTLVMFTSDNGAHHEGGHDHEFFNSNGHLRGYKRDLYEGGIRVPFIARWPGIVDAGSVNDHIFAFWDMLPTFSEIGGIGVSADIDGISMLPTLKGDDEKQKDHEYLYWEFMEGRHDKQGARIGNWKAVLYKTKEDTSSIQVFDLTSDPSEENDIAAEHPEIVEKALQIFEEAHVENPYFKFYTEKRI
jgi:arylsulfatase A-like enzyme